MIIFLMHDPVRFRGRQYSLDEREEDLHFI